MRRCELLVVVFGITALGATGLGCAGDTIGQPCTFSWPKTEAGEGENPVPDCATYPNCAPLQDRSQPMGDEPRNDNCPVECIQLPSLECTNLICVASQVDKTPSGVDVDRAQLMNGQCSAEVTHLECAGDDGAPFGCMGYCSKKCLSDASCPKGYRCARMAPFGENMRCENMDQWGGDVEDPDSDATKCTDNCLPAGTDIQQATGRAECAGKTCPGSVEGGEYTFDFSLCQYGCYVDCCACICYRFCPLLVTKYCRKVEWDQDLFPNGIVDPDTLKCAQDEGNGN